ncbi:hypothetical protein Pst134EB_004087 [Puccinia striiformis f. sp. tritici]|nr:hypothetical protein Pst134EB_004087 [Puccinia striiformis f. sp. tritici]
MPKGELGILIGSSATKDDDDDLVFDDRDDNSLPIGSISDPNPQNEVPTDLPEIVNDSAEEFQDAISSANSDSNHDVASSLVPIQSTRVLRERTSAIKPIKYSHLATDHPPDSTSANKKFKPTDPKTFKSAMKHVDKVGWSAAADE